MKLVNIVIPSICSVLLVACSHKPRTDIDTVCQRDDIGNYIIKWETTPEIDGSMELFVSNEPSFSKNSTSVSVTPINEGIATYVTNDNITRKYFCLVFNKKSKIIISSRNLPMDSVQNLRDMGGYITSDKKHTTKWGKVFRSGELSQLSNPDSLRLDNLQIKTIIDLRSKGESTVSPDAYSKAKIIKIAIPDNDTYQLDERLREGKIKMRDGLLYLQDTYLQYIDNYSDYFAQALQVFVDKKNYPILFHCTLGKDKSGFLAAMLLSAAGIDRDEIRADYMDSNNYIDVSRMASVAIGLNNDAQEAMTIILSANDELLDIVFDKITKEYGSVDKYLEKVMKLSHKDRVRIRENLLE